MVRSVTFELKEVFTLQRSTLRMKHYGFRNGVDASECYYLPFLL